MEGIVTAAVFAVRLRPSAEPRLSHEHDAARWVPIDAAHREVIWPGYRLAIERIRDDLGDPDRARWFELTREGDRRPIQFDGPPLVDSDQRGSPP
jgi:hypothetical protein